MTTNSKEAALELKKSITVLERGIKTAKANIKDFEGRQFNKHREKVLIFCLKRAIDIAEGSLCSAKAGLTETTGILTRAMLEIVFHSYWISLSDENAEKFTRAGHNDLGRNTKANLKEGYARVISKSTGEDKTQEFLGAETMTNIEGMISMKRVAQESGLEKLYTIFYGMSAMRSHGYTFGFDMFRSVEEDLYCSIYAIEGDLSCLNTILSNRVKYRRTTSVEEIYKILQIPKEN